MSSQIERVCVKVIFKSPSEIEAIRRMSGKGKTDAIGDYVDNIHECAAQIGEAFPDVLVRKIIWKLGIIVLSIPQDEAHEIMHRIRRQFHHPVERVTAI